MAAKKTRDIGKTFLMLLTAAIVAAVGVLFMLKFASNSVLMAILTVVASFVGSIVFAFLLQYFMKIVGKKSTFYDALTMITFGFFVMAWAYLLSSIIGLIPAIGFWLSGLIMLFAFVAANAVMLKAGMVFFESDILTIIIALTVVYVGVFSAMQFVAIQVMLESFGVLTGGALGSPYYPAI